MKNKSIFLIVLTSLLLCGCEPDLGPEIKDTKNQVTFEVIVVDGCQYLVRSLGGTAGVMTHKGNCTNSVHHKQ